jgi:exosortase A-associated hydrolase 1
MPDADQGDIAGYVDMTAYTETPVVFECQGNRLVGIATQPEPTESIGVLIVVGGPQYRAGSHRQFTLLARRLAQEGFASFRFDYRGMGDSEGDMRYFEAINDDICAAIDAFKGTNPSISKVVLWGLCDAASAILLYAFSDSRVAGQILLNPWVHSEAGAARGRLKHYYLQRLLQKSFWMKLFSGGIKLSQSVEGLTQSAWQAAGNGSQERVAPIDSKYGSEGYIDRMLLGFSAFNSKTLILLSGQDLVARAFQQLQTSDRLWGAACTRHGITQVKLDDANHTFSNVLWRGQVEEFTLKWLRTMAPFS